MTTPPPASRSTRGHNPPAVGYSVEVVTNDGHRINLSVPDAARLQVRSALQFPGPYARPTLHIHEVAVGQVREVRLWPDKPRDSAD